MPTPRSASTLVARLALPAALLAIGVARSGFAGERSASQESLFLGAIAATIVALLAFANLPDVRALSLYCVAAAVSIGILPAVAAIRTAAAFLVLAAAVGAAVLALRGAAPAPSQAGAGAWRLREVASIALAAQLLVRADRLVTAPLAFSTWLDLVLPAAFAGVALAAIARSGAWRAAFAGAAVFSVAPGWTTTGALALAVAAIALAPAKELRPPAWRTTIALLALLAPCVAEAIASPAPALATRLGELAAIAPAAVLAVAGGPSPAFATLAGVWTGALAFGATLAGSLPWHRADPIQVSLRLLGADDSPARVAVAIVLCGVVWRFGRRWTDAPRRIAFLTLAAIAASVVAALPRVAESAIGATPVTLTADRSSWQAHLGGQPVRELVVDSYLTNSVDLPAGTIVATVQLVDADGARTSEAIAVGRDSADWASARPDVAARLPTPAPQPWLSWFPSTGHFLGSTFRSVRSISGSHPALVRIERGADLPASTAITVFALELRR